MSMWFELLLLVLTVGVVFLRLIQLKRPKNYPPGPANYPIVGAGFFLSSLKCKTDTERFDKLGELFGPITGVYFGTQLGIITNGYEACKELLTKNEFGHRSSNSFLTRARYDGQERGIFFTNGNLWHTQRKFTIRSLREFGFGKSNIEQLIHEEIQGCILGIQNSLKQSPNSVTTMHDKFGVAIINILWTIMSGTRHSHDDKELKELLDKIENLFRSGTQGVFLVNSFPFTRYIPILNHQYNVFMGASKSLQQFIRKTIFEHSKSLDKNNSRDFIEDYLNQIENEKDKIESTFSEEQLVAICADLFSAGSESTSHTVAFAILYMILYPEIQRKVQAELDLVVGPDGLPSLNDFKNLPYTEAVLNEVLRISPIAPVSVVHSNIEGSSELMGYNIPKDTYCLANIRSVHMEKSYWGDPEVFRPERLIDSITGMYKKSERILAFGLGNRMCLGESLARMSYYLFFTSILKQFKLELGPPGSLHPTTEFRDGFTVSPFPFEAKITSRFQ